MFWGACSLCLIRISSAGEGAMMAGKASFLCKGPGACAGATVLYAGARDGARKLMIGSGLRTGASPVEFF